jgi:hypothetical protein
MKVMLFRSKTCHILLSSLFTSESLASVAVVLTIFSLLFMTTDLVSYIGTIVTALAILTDCLCVDGCLLFPSIKALHQD